MVMLVVLQCKYKNDKKFNCININIYIYFENFVERKRQVI